MEKRKISVLVLILLLFLPSFLGEISPSVRSEEYEKQQNMRVNNQNDFSFSEFVKEPSFLEELHGMEYGQKVDVIIKPKENTNVIELYKENIEHIYNSYPGFNGFFTLKELEFLCKSGMIEEIWRNGKLTITSSINQNINLDSLNFPRSIVNISEQVNTYYLWDEGFTGTNMTIALLDTGISLLHPAINQTSARQPRIIETKNFLSNTSSVTDDNGHGTALAGIMVGNGLDGHMKGVAPDANLLVGKILSATGTGDVSLLLTALDWAKENDADIINLSLGRSVESLDAPEVVAVNNIVKAGIMVCVAVGNSRLNDYFGYNDYFTTLSPGVASQALTVGAVDSNNLLYEYSSSGPVGVNYDTNTGLTLFDNVDTSLEWTKPDILAPGVNINTTSAVSHSYTIVSGTSFATAVISALTALLLQKHQEKGCSTVKIALMEESKLMSRTFTNPLGSYTSYNPMLIYQEVGVVTIEKTDRFLTNSPTISLWPKSTKVFDMSFFPNEQKSIKIHLFINKLVNNVSFELSKEIGELITINTENMKLENFIIGQHDVIIDISTKDKEAKTYYFNLLAITDGETSIMNFNISINEYKGDALIDCFEKGESMYYSYYGNMFTLLKLANSLGLRTIIKPRDMNYKSLSELNLNNYEVIIITNLGSSNIRSGYGGQELEALKDYILATGEAKGNFILLPSQSSNLIQINHIIEHLGVNYILNTDTSRIVNYSNNNVTVLNEPYTINKLYIPFPLSLIDINNTNLQMIGDEFAVVDNRNNNGSFVFLGNNPGMFSDSSYLYSPLRSKYDENVYSYNYANNKRFITNILSTSTTTANISYCDIESNKIDEVIEICVYASTYNKKLTGKEFFVEIEQGSYTVNLGKMEEKENGNYTLSLIAKNNGFEAGNIVISIRSLYGTHTIIITLFAKISWGPLYFLASVITATVFLLYYTKRSSKK